MIGYAITVAGTVFLLEILGGYFLFVLLVMEIVVLAADVIMSGVLIRGIELVFANPMIYTAKGEQVLILPDIYKDRRLVSYEARLEMSVRNRFYGTNGSTQIALPLFFYQGLYYRVPLSFSLLGLYELSVSRITVRDLLGLYDVTKQIYASTAVMVFPKGERESGYDMSLAAAGMTEADETDRRGNDFSDISEIREYAPGDRLRDIHWKLSAKRDELMIKQRTAMSDERLVVLVEFTDILSENDEVVDEAYALAGELTRANVNAQLMWWSAAQQDFRCRELTDQAGVDEAFTDMLSERAVAEDDTAELMHSIHPEITGYVRVFFLDGQAQEAVVDAAQ